MDEALKLAKKSLKINPSDVPVGCLIVKDGKIISSAYNTCERDKCISGHAEINALNAASKILNSCHLQGCKLFVTLEPCPMCAGAIRSAQISEIYFGAFNITEGAAGTVYNIIPKHVKVFGGIKKSDCESLLKNYFIQIRK